MVEFTYVITVQMSRDFMPDRLHSLLWLLQNVRAQYP